MIVSSVGEHNGQPYGQAPARIDSVCHGGIEQVQMIDDLRSQLLSNNLFGCSDKVPERMLISIAPLDAPVTRGPPFVVVFTAAVRLKRVRAAAQRAKHGRARSCGHSTLAGGSAG